MTEVIEKLVSFDEDMDGLFIKHEQEIPDWYLDSLADARLASHNEPMGDLVRVCSIPTSVYEDLRRYGYDVEREPIAQTIALLRSFNMQKFLTTDKSF